MRQLSSIITLCSLTLMLAGPAFADTLSEQNEKLQKYGSLANIEQYCKFKFDVSIDTKSFTKAAAKKGDKVKDLYSHCDTPLRAVKHWCSMGYTASVKKQISSYVCQHTSGKSKVTLKKGVLTLATNWEQPKHKWVEQAVGTVLTKGGFNLNQAALIKNDSDRIKSTMGDMKRRCGKNIKWTVDWKSFKPALDKRVSSNNLNAIWQHCSASLQSLEKMCNNDQKKLMTDQVDSFVCRFDKNNPPKMTLKGKVLTLTSDIADLNTRRAKILVADTLRDGDFSVRQAAFIRDEDAHLERLYSKQTNKSCKTKIAWSIDWKSFEEEVDKRLSREETTSIFAACSVPLNRLGDVCASDRKNKVKKKIKSYTCMMGKKKLKLVLKKGKLQYYVNFSAKDAYGAVDKFLIKNRIIKKRPEPKKLSTKDLAKIRQIFARDNKSRQCRQACVRKNRWVADQRKCKNSCN